MPLRIAPLSDSRWIRSFPTHILAQPLLLAILLAGALALAASAAQAQVSYDARHRPPGDFRVAETGRFEMIYPAGTDTTAALFQGILQRSFQEAQSIVGTDVEDFQLPVVVDPLSDRANGFVAPTNFRSVFFTPHPTSEFGAKFDSWAQTLAPHELTHALHYEIDSGVGIGGLAGLFSEDLSRGLHNLQPRGWAEGIAVYRESQLKSGAGRLNAPLATMKYRASLTSGDPWSVGEVMYPGLYERPRNRHYLGGGQLIEYMAQKRGGTEFFRRTARWAHRLPFLGFGMAMWMGTGQTPAQLSDSFLKAERRVEHRRLDSLRRAAEQGMTDPTVLAGTDGLHVRRPYWTSDSTLVAYMSGYATRPGFYRIDARTGERDVISHQATTKGRTYALGPDTTALYFARQHPGVITPMKTVQKVHRLNLRSGEATLVSEAGGVFTPAKEAGGPIWAAQRDGSFSDLVTLGQKGTTTRVGRPGLRYKQVAPSPEGSAVAVLANAGGTQGLYRFDPSTSTLEPWVRFENGTIHDVNWGPEGRYLLFAADPSGVSNVYAFDTRTEDIQRLTSVRYGALEPALSPDGETVAFARYRHERFELATIPFRPESSRPVADIERNWTRQGGAARARAASGGETEEAKNTVSTAVGTGGTANKSTATESGPASTEDPFSRLQAGSLREQSRSYEAWRHLAPRSVFPTLPGSSEPTTSEVSGEDLGAGIGLKLSGVDPLRRWAYNVEGFYRADRLWGEGSVETGLLPGTPSVTAFTRPFESASEQADGSSRIEAYEEQGLGLSARQRFLAEKNVFTTSVTAGLGTQFRQTRPITASGDPDGDFSGRLTLRPSLTAKYRVQKNIRDLVPNTGLVSRTRVEADVATAPDAEPSRALIQELSAYWPFLASVNGGLRTSVAVLSQNQGSLFDTQSFAPRGYRDVASAQPGPGNYLRVGAKYTQPLWYIDTGSVMLPVAIDALYGYGLGQAQYQIDGGSGPTFGERRASVGAGLGVQFRPFGNVNVKVEVGVSYRLDTGPDTDAWTPHVGTPGTP